MTTVVGAANMSLAGDGTLVYVQRRNAGGSTGSNIGVG